MQLSVCTSAALASHVLSASRGGPPPSAHCLAYKYCLLDILPCALHPNLGGCNCTSFSKMDGREPNLGGERMGASCTWQPKHVLSSQAFQLLTGGITHACWCRGILTAISRGQPSQQHGSCSAHGRSRHAPTVKAVPKPRYGGLAAAAISAVSGRSAAR